MSSTLPEYLRGVHVLDGDVIRRPVDIEDLNALGTVDNIRVTDATVGDVRVSTVFDMYKGRFETETFDDENRSGYDGLTWRYATRAEAQAGHDRIVAALTAGEDLAEVTL